MKNITIFGLLIFASAMLTSCGVDSNEKKLNQKTTNAKVDSLIIETPKKTVINDITPAKVTVKIFFRTRDMSGYEEYEDIKPETYIKTSERDEFRKKNKYTFCYDSEEFNSLEISGIGEKLNLVVKEGNKVIFSKPQFDIKDKLRFTTNDFYLDMGVTYTITLSQNEKVLFKGVIDSQGCM
jgi:hypothetical protein